MDLTASHLFDFLTNALSPADRAATERALANSPAARETLARLATARATMQSDATWSVPANAVERAIALGRRLDERRQPSLLERLSASVQAIVAQIRFDTRLDGALVGLRGGTGFAVSYRAGTVDIDLECDSNDDETFAILGQLTDAEPSTAHVRFLRVDVHGQDANATETRVVATSAIDAAGLFRVSLRPGRYLLRFVPQSGSPVDLPCIEIP